MLVVMGGIVKDELHTLAGKREDFQIEQNASSSQAYLTHTVFFLIQPTIAHCSNSHTCLTIDV